MQAWKAEVLSKLESVFDRNAGTALNEVQLATLERKVGQLEVAPKDWTDWQRK